MEGKEAWKLLADNVGLFKAVEWTENAGGGTFHARIWAIALNDGGSRIDITFKWCAMQNLASKSYGGWAETLRRMQLSFSQDTLLCANINSNGQIDFETKSKVGTFYPSHARLQLHHVRRLGKMRPASK